MKLLFKFVAVLIVVVLIGLVGLIFYVDSIAKSAIEGGATQALGVKTTLGSAKIGMFKGTFGMSGLRVSNPDGFNSPHFLTLGEGGVKVSLGTLMDEKVVMQELTLSSIDMNLERTGEGANYQKILDNLKGEEQSTKPESKEGKKFVISKLLITDVKVHCDLLSLGGGATKVTIPIDKIELTDVGSESDKGVVLWELSGVLIKAIITAAIQQGGNLIPQDILGDLSSQLAGLQSLGDMGIDMTSKLGQEIGSAAKGIADEAGKALEGATKGVDEALKGIGGGLLGGGQKKDQ